MDDKYTDKQVCDILGDNHFSNLLQYVLHMFGTMPRSMTEEEIIQYLKMNKKVGIPLGFMPTEVQEWCNKNSLSLQIIIENKNVWDDYKNWVISKKLEFTSIVCLPDDYKIQPNINGEWIEFNIDKSGHFHIKIERTTYSFHWMEFIRPLLVCEKYKDDNMYLTNFGGWQYEDSKRWYLAPAVKLQDGEMWNSYVIEQSGEATPVIPVKIRFWKEYK